MIEVEIEAEAWTGQLADAEALVIAAAEAALKGAKAEGGIVVLLADDAAIHELNQQFRDKDQATNVLSFPAAENPEHHLGDVALAFETCLREAKDQSKPLAHHLQHLVTHGVLHLLGYDHITDAEADQMEGLERIVLAGLGIPDPYAAEAGDHV